jgi:hypothetical protein
MNKTILVIATAALGAASLYAQNAESLPIDLGFKVGVPITNMFSASNTSEFNQTIPGSPFSSAVPRYEFGVSGGFHLYKGLRFEVDGIYKRGGFESVFANGGSGFAYSPTTFNWWEIPGLIKTDVSLGHVRPFVDFGAALRHISTIDQTTYAAGLFDGVSMTDNSMALHNRNSYGGVAGIGITFKKGALRISPEVRYTRWANEAFEYTGFRTNLNQGDFLLGINF